MAEPLTPERYRKIVSQIPESDVVSAINTSDARDGLGNQYSMFLLEQYFKNQLPTQQIAQQRREQREPGDTTPVTQPNSTASANVPRLEENFVGRRFGADPSEASAAFDKAYDQKYNEFFAEVSDDSSMNQMEKANYANQNAIRYVRSWYDLPRTAGGAAMPAATITGLQGVLAKQGFGAIAQALKPRTYKKSEAIAQLQEQGRTDPQAAREARRLLSEFFTAEEDEARYMEVRPQIRAQAQKEVKEQWDEIVSEYMESQGFEPVVGPYANRWKKTETVTKPAVAVGGYGARSGSFTGPRTSTSTIEIDAPNSWQDWVDMMNAQPKPERELTDRELQETPEAQFYRPERKKEEAPTAEVATLQGIRDYFNSRVDRVEERIVQQNRQSEARNFYREAVSLVREHYKKQGISLPEFSPGQEGSEQRAQFEALPQELQDNYSDMMTTAIKLGRQKTEEHDFVIYRDYLEDELGTSQESDRIGFRLPFSDKTLRIDYEPDQLRTRIASNVRDFGYGTVYTQNEYGDVAETWVGTGFRDLGGLIRFATSPAFKAFTYDVDENGNPIDPTDWNYRFDQWTSRAYERMQTPVSGPLSFGRRVADTAGTVFAELVPSRMAKTVSTGRRGRINTGSYLQDVAVEIYNNRYLGDDFNELVATRTFWEQKGMPWVPGAAGLGVEVALPLTPYPFVSAAIRNSGKTLQAVDAAIRSGKMSDLLSSMKEETGFSNPYKHRAVRRAEGDNPEVGRLGRIGRVMENPVEEARVAILASVARNLIRTARGVDEIQDLTNVISHEARLPRQLGVRVAGEIIELFDFSTYEKFLESLQTIRGMHWGSNSTDVANIIEDLAGVAERIQKAKKTNSIADLKSDPQGQIIIDEMGVQSAIGVQPSSDAFIRNVLHGYLSEKVTNELINYVPNRYVLATGNVIVPISKWKKNQRAVQKEIGERLKVDEEAIKADAGWKYENTKDASNLLVRAYGMAKINNTPFLKDIYRKLRKDQPLTMEEFTSIDQILRGSIVKGKITDSYRLTHTGSAFERASEAASGRQLTLPRNIEDFRRATNLVERVFAYVKRNPTPPPAKISPKKLPEGVEVAKLKPWNEITDRFSKIDETIRKEIVAARSETGDPWDAMTLIMQKYGSDNPVDDVMSVLFGSPSNMAGGFFGNTAAIKGMDWDASKKLIEKHLNRLGIDQFSPAAVVESIDLMRKQNPALARRSSALRAGADQPAGMGARVTRQRPTNVFMRFLLEEGSEKLNYRKIKPTDTPAQRAAAIDHNAKLDRKLAANSDYADAQIYAFIIDAKKSEIVKEVTSRFERLYPELTIPLSKPTSMNETTFRTAVVESLVGATKTDAGLNIRNPGEISALVDDLVRKTAGWLFRGESNIVGGLNAADMRFVMNAIIKDIYTHGTMNMLSSQRIADVFYSRAGLGKEQGVVAVASRAAKLKEVVTKTLRNHVRKTTKESDWLPNTPAQVDELATLISGRIMSDFIESTTGQTIDTIMGNLSSVGLPVRIDSSSVNLPELQASLVQMGEDFAILMPNQTKFMIPAQELILIEDLIKSSATGDLERNLENLRARDAETYDWVVNNLGNLYHVTKRSTIGGLLGGFGPFAALRFHGVNVFTAPMIIAITAPQLALQSIRNIPGAALSFTKPVTEALYPTLNKAQRFAKEKIPGASGSFNWLSNKFSHDPNKILFVDKWGSPWTRARYQESVRRNNIRFSQVTYEFRDAVINEVRRAASLMPNLTKASYGTQILRWFDPTNKSLWTRWAEEADMAFREGVYAAALKEGATEAVASNLAKNALLDYGKIPKSERNVLTKGMLFYAFKRQIMLETASAFLRNGDSLKLLRAQMTMAMRQQQEMEVWTNNEDWQKTRLWVRLSKDFDDVKNYLYGLEPPALGTLSDLANMAGALLDSGLYLSGKQPTTYIGMGDALKAGEDTFLAHPFFQWALDEIAIFQGRGTSETPQGMMRPEWVYFFQNTGSWAIAEKLFDLEATPWNKRRPNEYLQITGPDGKTINSQWKFGSKRGRANFIRFYMLTTVVGANRVMRDWSTSAIIDDESEDIVWKRRGEGNRWLNLFGLETPGSLEGPAGIVYTQAGERLKAMNSLAKD